MSLLSLSEAWMQTRTGHDRLKPFDIRLGLATPDLGSFLALWARMGGAAAMLKVSVNF